MSRSRRDDHVVLIPPGTLLCRHCGQHHELTFPMQIQMVSWISSGFTRDHKACKIDKRHGLACPSCYDFGHPFEQCPRLDYKGSPLAWRRGPDTGLSSLTIWYCLMGQPNPERNTTPSDPDDFGRCHRLLHAIPGWRARLGELVTVDGWAPLVAAWDDLERLYLEELPTGQAPNLYARLRHIKETSPHV